MEKKNKQKINNYLIGITLIIITILLVGGFIYKKMPREVCHNKYNVEKIELKAFCYETEYYSDCISDFATIPENAIEVICEDGVNELWGDSLETYSKEQKVCLIKTSTEVCEVVYP